MAAIEAEYSEAIPYPAAVVFAALADLEGRQDWQPDIVSMRVDPAAPAQVGSQVHEARNNKGHKTEATLIVSVCEPDKLLVLETVGDAKQPSTERYQIDGLPDGTCRLNCRIDMDGIPKMAQYLVRQGLTKQIPEYVSQLTKKIKNGS